MPNHSSIVQIGHITRDPELRSTPSGKFVAKSGLATNHRFGQGDQSKDEVCFIDFEIWGSSAESLAKHVHKGDAILIEGRLKMDSWDDKTSGQKRTKHVISVSRWSFMGGKKDEADAPARSVRPARQPALVTPEESDVPF